MKKYFYTLIIATIANIAFSQSEKEIVINDFISGTLITPFSEANTLVIIHPGSGPTDKNGNQPHSKMENNSLKMLADSLAKYGYASFRVDKRVIKAMYDKNFDESKLNFDIQVNDLNDVVNHFRKNFSYKKIILAGHSEGSLISILSCQRSKVDGFISICGPGRPADVVLLDQIKASAPFIKDTCAVVLKMLKKGVKPDTIMPLLNGLFRPSVQPYLINWIQYDPALELSKLNVPVHIIVGDNDLQVKVDEANYLHDAYPSAHLSIIKGMNHVLKICEKDLQKNAATYSNPNLPLSHELVKEITFFLKLNKM